MSLLAFAKRVVVVGAARVPRRCASTIMTPNYAHFGLTPEQQALQVRETKRERRPDRAWRSCGYVVQANVHKFAQAQLAPRAAEIDKSNQFPMGERERERAFCRFCSGC
jgi:hypothetical protein